MEPTISLLLRFLLAPIFLKRLDGGTQVMKQTGDQHRDRRITYQRASDRHIVTSDRELNLTEQVGPEAKVNKGICTKAGNDHKQEAARPDDTATCFRRTTRPFNMHGPPKTLEVQPDMGEREREPPVGAQHMDSAREGGSRQNRQKSEDVLRCD